MPCPMQGSPQLYLAAVLLLCASVSHVILQSVAQTTPCSVHERYRLELYSIESGMDTMTKIRANDIASDTPKFSGTCYSILAKNTGIENAVYDVKVLYKNDTNSCYFCYHFLWRSNNVLQYRHTQCSAPPSGLSPETICGMQTSTELETGFVMNPKQDSYYNCKSIIEGVYQFDYKIRELTGMCKSPDSRIKACQRQGSPLRDNMIFTMEFGYCPSVQPVAHIWIRKFVFYCYARWVDTQNNIWAAVRYDAGDTRFRFRCMMTRLDQQNPDNMQIWGLTLDANCKTMKTFFDSPMRLEVRPALDPDDHLPEMVPGCKLPLNFTGNWFYPSEYSTTVIINSTHITFRRKWDQYRYEEIYFVCRQSQESRYMMATVTQGRCDVDFLCFYFMPRHHNIIRFRMGRPFRHNINPNMQTPKDYMQMMFRDSCHWNTFTLNYLDWVYEYFVLDPPTPINCPIQGRYRFTQHGAESEQYYTKIPMGVTPRPRVQVVCPEKWQTDFASCVDNPKDFHLDVQRCMRLDFTGRPMVEYDVADNVIYCVGYWMEDTNSYLITYDPLDPVNHHFRCWVYRRLGFQSYTMSRSLSGQCAKYQTALSEEVSEGASLRMELVENELEFEGCPMRYDDGRDPYANPAVLEVFSGSVRVVSILSWRVLLSLAVLSVVLVPRL